MKSNTLNLHFTNYVKLGIIILIAIYTCCSGGIEEEEPATDTTPPSISNGSPSGELNTGTNQTTISVTTDENATCKYSTSQSTNFSSMPSTFSTTGDTSHSTVVTGLQDENSYNYYVRCQDESNNANASDYDISFSISKNVVADGDLNIPLTISDTAAINRTSEPVTSGIPLPESANITTINQLMVTNSQNNNIPAQFTVLARWNGTPEDISKPIKWVLLDFQADVSANNSATYYLKSTSDGGNTTNPNLSVQDNADNYVINTGKAKYHINKKYFNLFDYVYIDSDNNGQLDNEIVSQPNQGGVVLTDKEGKQYTALLEAPEVIEIEEQGPMRTVINIRGVLKASDGTYYAPSANNPAASSFYSDYPRFGQPYAHSFVYYNCRIHFYNNQDYVKVFFTLENNGSHGQYSPESYYAPIQAVYFDSVNMVFKTVFNSTSNVISEDSNVSLSASDIFTLTQDWHENLTDEIVSTQEPKFADGIYYTTKMNTGELSTGHTNPGWVDSNNQNRGVSLAVRHFWQNFPTKITVEADELIMGFWPEEGYYPYCQDSSFTDTEFDKFCKKAGRDAGAYYFDAGRHKTYEVGIRFYDGSQSYTDSKHLSQVIEHPLMALAPSEWYASSKALGLIAPAGLTSTDPEIDEAMEKFEQHQRAMVYAEDSENGYTINNLKTNTTPHWELDTQNRYFNWMNFGDLLWGDRNPCALHYDWTYSMLLHYIRTGKKKFFDTGVAMAKHRYDVDQYHGDRTDSQGNHKWGNHMQFYETSGHADPSITKYHSSFFTGPSHTWNGGLVLYYLLTGDHKSWGAAMENGQGALTRYGTGGLQDADINRPAQHETRMETWPILNLINLYRVSGDDEYLRVAKNIAKNRLLEREQLIGGQGYFGVGDGADLSDSRQSKTMWTYAIEAMINIHYETQDEELRQLLIRMADFTKDRLLFGGYYIDENEYMPLQNSYSWHKDDPDGLLTLVPLVGKTISEVPSYYGIKKSYDAGPSANIYYADLFAYTYTLTNNSEYLDKARQSFKDAMFYYAAAGQGITTSNGVIIIRDGHVDPNYRSKMSFIDSMYPNSHTKVHGWLGRTNQIYLNTEWQLQ